MLSFEIYTSEQIKLAKNKKITFIEAGNKIRDYYQNGAWSPYRYNIKQILDKYNNDLNISIFDYGCGTGKMVMALKCAGFKNSFGADVMPKFDNNLFYKLGFGENTFKIIETKHIPYRDGSFDVLCSNEVIEHVFDHHNYYSEASRVLKDNGTFYIHAPQRLQPYDTHSRCWFIHYFPKKIRILLWNLFTHQGGDYLESYLNLKTISYHKKISSHYFSSFETNTANKIKAKNYQTYKGNSFLRNFASYLMNLPIIGNLFIKIFVFISSTEIHLVK